MSHNLQTDFNAWADSALANTIPKSVVAFNFNLYESLHEFHADVIGSNTYDDNDPDWACNETFVERNTLFRLPHQIVGTEWRQALDAAAGLLRAYLQSDCAGAATLRRSTAVTVGF